MIHRFKASTIVETLIASVVIMTAFASVLMLFGTLTSRISSGRDYIRMKHARDAVLASVSQDGLYGDRMVIEEWGRVEVKVLNQNLPFIEIEAVSEMTNGQIYRQIYLICDEP